MGCHHIVTSSDGKVAASAGFGGELKTWTNIDGKWSERRNIVGMKWPFKCPIFHGLEGLMGREDENKAGEIWAIALSENGQYIAATSFDGRVNVWDDVADGVKIREFETKGSFGMSIDMVSISNPRYDI
jgi:superkiller protein 8